MQSMDSTRHDWNADETSPAFLLAEEAIRCILEKKGEEIVLLDLRERSDFCDFFLICTGHTDVQTTAIARAVQEGLAVRGHEKPRVEGLPEGRWVLLDYFDVIVHIFQPEARRYYLLERLWGDAPRLEVPEDYFADADVRRRHPQSTSPAPSGGTGSEEPETA
jgi:ribosome-associated protein